MRFDQAAAYLARRYGFTERNDLRDRVWVGGNFQEEVRTSGRDGERRALRVEHHGIFFQVTADRALDRE